MSLDVYVQSLITQGLFTNDNMKYLCLDDLNDHAQIKKVLQRYGLYNKRWMKLFCDQQFRVDLYQRWSWCNILVVLVIGARGFVGSLLKDRFEVASEQNGRRLIFVEAKSRMEDMHALQKEINVVRPDRVILCAGKIGNPTVDSCEKEVELTLHTNIAGVLNVAKVCWDKKIHLTYFGTGCIYTGGDDQIFSEDDAPNFTGSIYSYSKKVCEDALKRFDNVLILRIRMPMINDITHPKNIITKLLRYDNLVKVQNSISYMEELIPISLHMMVHEVTGIYNFTNPGSLNHPQIVEAFGKTNYKIISMEEHDDKFVVAKRSRCVLDTRKLQDYVSDHNLKLSSAEEALVHVAAPKRF